MRIATDIAGLQRAAGPKTEILTLSRRECPNRWYRNLRLVAAAARSDYLVVHFSFAEVFLFSVLLFVIPFQRCRLVTLDFFVMRPKKWQLQLIRWSLGRIDKLLVYFRDSARFEELCQLPPESFHYIPFKVNSWELVQKAEIADEGYIFVGGRSRRDFRTLFQAVKDLPFPVKVLTGSPADLARHGSSLEGLTPPSNVEMFYNDSDSRFFVDLMAKARLVVLPILGDSAVQAGIGVYLIGMALRKCVIISDAPGVGDVLLNGEACIVPPGDVEALRQAIETLWRDDNRRETYAAAGYRYAYPLAGEDRLFASILGAIGANTAGDESRQTSSARSFS